MRDEEQKQGFGEVAQDADDGENHTCEVAVCVADEDAGGIPIVPPESNGDAEKGKEHVEGEKMAVGSRMKVGC